MDFNAIWSRVQRAVKLESGVYSEIANDAKATNEAFVISIVATLIGGLGAAFPGGTRFSFGSWLIGGVVGGALGLIIGAGVLWLISRLFKATGGYVEMLRALGYATAPRALGIIPFIGGLVGGIWSLILAVRAVKESQSTTDGAAWAIVLIPVVVFAILGLLVFAATMAAFLGFAALD